MPSEWPSTKYDDTAAERRRATDRATLVAKERLESAVEQACESGLLSGDDIRSVVNRTIESYANE